jgi:hypothetical protein
MIDLKAWMLLNWHRQMAAEECRIKPLQQCGEVKNLNLNFHIEAIFDGMPTSIGSEANADKCFSTRSPVDLIQHLSSET